MFAKQIPNIICTFVDETLWKPQSHPEEAAAAAKHHSKIISTFNAFKADLENGGVWQYKNFPEKNILLKNEPQLQTTQLQFNSSYILSYLESNASTIKNKIESEIRNKNSLLSVVTPYDIRFKTTSPSFLYYIDTEEIVLILKKIGQGAFRSIFMGLNISKKQILALGEQMLFDNEDRNNSKSEEQILKQLRSAPHILQLYRSDYQYTHTLTLQTFLCTEYCDFGALTNHMDRLSWGVKVRIAGHILQGVQEIHKIQCLHRDIKPDNILLKTVGSKIHAVVADFGFACSINSPTLNKLYGTPYYLPVEVIKRTTKHNYLSDAWSIGVVFSELFYEEHPLGFNTDSLSNSEYVSLLEKLEQATIRESLLPTVEKKTLPYLLTTSPLDQVIRKLLQPESSRMRVEDALQTFKNTSFKRAKK